MTIDGQAVRRRGRRVLDRARRRSVAGANGPRVGAARIIDISDETKPRVVSEHPPRGQPAREPRRRSPATTARRARVQGYAGALLQRPARASTRGSSPARSSPRACACSTSATRRTRRRSPTSWRRRRRSARPAARRSTSAPTGRCRSPAFAPERNEIWYSDGNSGFYALKLEDNLSGVLAGSSNPGCIENRGFKAAAVRGAHGRLRVQMARKQKLPVRVDLYRVTAGRKVVGELRVGSVKTRSKSFTWPTRLARASTSRASACTSEGRLFDLRRVVFERTRGGADPDPPRAPPSRELQAGSRLQGRATGVRRPDADPAAAELPAEQAG